MHVLIATTGALAPQPVAELAARLVGEAGRVSIITVIEVPRSFLDDIRSDEWNPLAEGVRWGPPQDAVIQRYVEERGRRLTAPLQVELKAHGIDAEVHYLEGEEPAGTIVEAAEKLAADVLVLGATRPIFDEASWESVSVRVIQDGRRPVVVVPAPARHGDDEDEPE